ncbi:MAG: hypothetical protein KDE21_00240 [Novosphingobium sp.]|nr:hypothetical protein [Novosphingobium sp.]
MQPAIGKFRVASLKVLAGARFRLREKTAALALSYDGTIPDLERFDEAMRSLLAEVQPSEADGLRWPQGACAADPEGPFEEIWPRALGNRVLGLLLLLQRWAREPVLSGEILEAVPGRLTLAAGWWREPALRALVELTLRLLALAGSDDEGGSPEEACRQIAERIEQVRAGGLSPVGYRLAMAACRKDHPVSLSRGFVQIGWGAQARRLNSTITDATSSMAVGIARLKYQTNRLLADARLPVPASAMVATVEQALEVAEGIGWPVVLKPANQDGGKGVAADIGNPEQLRSAFETAERHSPRAVVVERHIAGDDHRMLVVGGRLLAVTKRTPGGVTGDGTKTVAQLLEELNSNPSRGAGKRSMLVRIDLDREAMQCLEDQELTPESVPAPGRVVRLRRIANISTGGTAEDVSDRVHPDNRALAIRAARIVGLDIAGVDFICPDIDRSWREVGGAICEVNAQPTLRVHWLGAPERDIEGEIVDWLAHGQSTRIPTAVITGTNGKSTTARMLHRIWMAAGKTAGVCTTQGLLVGNDLASTKNMAGAPGARILMHDPAVESAIVEQPRQGILYLGHPFDQHDVGALLNVQDDHIGVDGIASLDDMARLKAEVLRRARSAVVVNAEDSRCLAVRQLAGCPRHLLVARDPATPALREHLAAGGEGVFLQEYEGESWIALARGGETIPLMPVSQIPSSLNGVLRFNVCNAMFAAAIAWAQGLEPKTIREALAAFENSFDDNPGRYNFIDGQPFQVLLDYAHNPDSARELFTFVAGLPAEGKRRLLNLKLGNRHKSHFQELAPQMARTFDSFVLGCDERRTREGGDYGSDDPVALMLDACRQALHTSGVGESRMVCEARRPEIFRKMFEQALPGDLIVILAEPWEALEALSELRRDTVDR